VLHHVVPRNMLSDHMMHHLRFHVALIVARYVINLMNRPAQFVGTFVFLGRVVRPIWSRWMFQNKK
jgi:hypothetical protein